MKILIEYFFEVVSFVMDYCIKCLFYIWIDLNYIEFYDFYFFDLGFDDEVDLNGNCFFGFKMMVKFNCEDFFLYFLM